MTELSSAQQGQIQAQRSLSQLGIFYYVLSGFSALAAMVPIVHVLIGGAMVLLPPSRASEGPPAKLVGSIFVVVGLIVIALGLCYAGFMFYAGRCLRRRTNLTLVQVAAAMACINMPLGTILGIVTFMELNKDEVRTAFTDPIPVP